MSSLTHLDLSRVIISCHSDVAIYLNNVNYLNPVTDDFLNRYVLDGNSSLCNHYVNSGFKNRILTDLTQSWCLSIGDKVDGGRATGGRVAGDRVAGNSVTGDEGVRATGERVTGGRVIGDERLAGNTVIGDERVRAAGDEIVRVIGDIATGERATGERVTADKSTGDRVTGDKAAGVKAAGERSTGGVNGVSSGCNGFLGDGQKLNTNNKLQTDLNLDSKPGSVAGINDTSGYMNDVKDERLITYDKLNNDGPLGNYRDLNNRFQYGYSKILATGYLYTTRGSYSSIDNFQSGSDHLSNFNKKFINSSRKGGNSLTSSDPNSYNTDSTTSLASAHTCIDPSSSGKILKNGLIASRSGGPGLDLVENGSNNDKRFFVSSLQHQDTDLNKKSRNKNIHRQNLVDSSDLNKRGSRNIEIGVTSYLHSDPVAFDELKNDDISRLPIDTKNRKEAVKELQNKNFVNSSKSNGSLIESLKRSNNNGTTKVDVSEEAKSIKSDNFTENTELSKSGLSNNRGAADSSATKLLTSNSTIPSISAVEPYTTSTTDETHISSDYSNPTPIKSPSLAGKQKWNSLNKNNAFIEKYRSLDTPSDKRRKSNNRRDSMDIDEKVDENKSKTGHEVKTSPEVTIIGLDTTVDDYITKKKLDNLSIKTPLLAPSTTFSLSRTLPENYMDCSMEDLITITSRMLQNLITLNDKSVPKAISNPKENTEQTMESTSKASNSDSASAKNIKSSDPSNSLLTRYHSRTPPQISINSYLGRLAKFNNFNPANILSTIYYIDLLSYHYSPFFTLNSWTIHRFLLVASMISQKSMEDFFFTNDHYAKVGGINIVELNCLELDFLYRVNWKCIPVKNINEKVSSIKHSSEVLSLYYNNLIDLMGSNTKLSDNNITYHLEREGSEENGKDNDEVIQFDSDSSYDDNTNSDIESDEDINEKLMNEQEFRFNLMDYNGYDIHNGSSPHLKRNYGKFD